MVLAHGVARTAASAARTYGEARAELAASARRLGVVLAETLGEQLRNDALWGAYRTVRRAAGLSPIALGADGRGGWVWNVSARTSPGTGTVTVTCSGDQSVSAAVEIV